LVVDVGIELTAFTWAPRPARLPKGVILTAHAAKLVRLRTSDVIR